MILITIIHRVNIYLLRIRIWRSNVSVTLTIYRWIRATTNSVHLPFRKIVIHYMKVPMSTPWHPLYQPSSKMIKCKRNLRTQTT